MPTGIEKQDASLLKDAENINQARLMALNAMFEAARVGKAGASLAVMADKIQQMSRDSAAALKKTKRPDKA